MLIVIILFCGVVMGGLFFWSTRGLRQNTVGEYPYVKKRYLCDKKERNFFRYLVRAVSQEYLVLTKVRYADLMVPDESVAGRQKREAIDKIVSRRADFVLVDRATTEVRLVIELFDERISSAKRIQQALFVDKLFKAISVPLVRIRVSDTYHINELKRAISDAEKRYVSLSSASSSGRSSNAHYNDLATGRRKKRNSSSRHNTSRLPARRESSLSKSLAKEKALPADTGNPEWDTMLEKLPESVSDRPSRINLG